MPVSSTSRERTNRPLSNISKLVVALRSRVRRLVNGTRLSQCGEARHIRFHSLVGIAGQVYCGGPAQRLNAFAHDWRIGAWARDQVDRQPDFRKRPRRAHRAEHVSSGKDDLEIGAPHFETGKELGYIG